MNRDELSRFMAVLANYKLLLHNGLCAVEHLVPIMHWYGWGQMVSAILAIVPASRTGDLT